MIQPMLNLLVLRCGNLEASRRFYQALGLALIEEKHGNGPVHYSCTLGPTVLELYPGTSPAMHAPTEMLGLSVGDISAVLTALDLAGFTLPINKPSADNSDHIKVVDPDGRKVLLYPR